MLGSFAERSAFTHFNLVICRESNGSFLIHRRTASRFIFARANIAVHLINDGTFMFLCFRNYRRSSIRSPRGWINRTPRMQTILPATTFTICRCTNRTVPRLMKFIVRRDNSRRFFSSFSLPTPSPLSLYSFQQFNKRTIYSYSFSLAFCERFHRSESNLTFLFSFFFLFLSFFFYTNESAGKLPMTPQEAVKYYGYRLPDFERAEIEKYSEIWYLGLSANKIHGEEGASHNGGYDDENGSYNKVLHDHISYRYV